MVCGWNDVLNSDIDVRAGAFTGAARRLLPLQHLPSRYFLNLRITFGPLPSLRPPPLRMFTITETPLHTGALLCLRSDIWYRAATA